ncbi:hypothetical protein GPALN_007504 [Globodera pallida]|nr:hypothetical protein GPALN_007504 [Globodera pallida]
MLGLQLLNHLVDFFDHDVLETRVRSMVLLSPYGISGIARGRMHQSFHSHENKPKILLRFALAVLGDCAKLRVIKSFDLFPKFPADDSAGASATQAVAKCLPVSNVSQSTTAVLFPTEVPDESKKVAFSTPRYSFGTGHLWPTLANLDPSEQLRLLRAKIAQLIRQQTMNLPASSSASFFYDDWRCSGGCFVIASPETRSEKGIGRRARAREPNGPAGDCSSCAGYLMGVPDSLIRMC